MRQPLLLLLVLLVPLGAACSSTGEPMDLVRRLPRVDGHRPSEHRPTLRVVAGPAGSGVTELLAWGRGRAEAPADELARQLVHDALAASGAFRLRDDSDARYDLRLQELSVSSGSTATARLRAELWDTAENVAVLPGIEVEGLERQADRLARLDLWSLAEQFDPEAETHRVNALQKALWKAAAQAQVQLP